MRSKSQRQQKKRGSKTRKHKGGGVEPRPRRRRPPPPPPPPPPPSPRLGVQPPQGQNAAGKKKLKHQFRKHKGGVVPLNGMPLFPINPDFDIGELNEEELRRLLNPGPLVRQHRMLPNDPNDPPPLDRVEPIIFVPPRLGVQPPQGQNAVQPPQGQNAAGKKKLKHQFRKHKGIVQTGGKKGKLRKGYRYSGKKLKSGLPQIIKCKSKKC